MAEKLKKCGTEEEMREIIGKICKNYLHGAWKEVDISDLEFRRITGGLSNFMYYVALPALKAPQGSQAPQGPKRAASLTESTASNILRYSESTQNMDEPREVLLRIYGQVHGERAMDAIVTESVIFTLLSERRLGPKLYGVFSGGRIEEFIHARPLLTKELSEPSLSMKIAEKCAAIHSMDVPLSKEGNWMWKTIAKWLKTVKSERLTDAVKGKNGIETEAIIFLKAVDFEKEVDWLKKFLATVESPILFCHNDLQEGNILLIEDEPETVDEFDQSFAQIQKDSSIQEQSPQIQTQSRQDTNSGSTHYPISAVPTFLNEDANTSDSINSHITDIGEPRLVLIDFEYCAFNYRGFDIANHFAEWVFDYTNPEAPYYYQFEENAPTLEQKEIFIKEYLKHYLGNTSDEEPSQSSIEAVNHLLNEVESFALAVHLFWGLWSIVNASKSQIPFGYWEYAVARIDKYLRLKQEMMKKDKFGLPQKRKIEEVDI